MLEEMANVIASQSSAALTFDLIARCSVRKQLHAAQTLPTGFPSTEWVTARQYCYTDHH